MEAIKLTNTIWSIRIGGSVSGIREYATIMFIIISNKFWIYLEKDNLIPFNYFFPIIKPIKYFFNPSKIVLKKDN